MEIGDSRPVKTTTSFRRTTRQSIKGVNDVLKLREPLKRKGKDIEDSIRTSVKGPDNRRRLPSQVEDELPKKRRRLPSKEDGVTDGDEQMDVHVDTDDSEGEEEQDEDNAAAAINHSTLRLDPLETLTQSPNRDVSPLKPPLPALVLRSRRSIHQSETEADMDPEALTQSTRSSKRLLGSPVANIPVRAALQRGNTSERPTVQSRIRQYHSRMQEGQYLPRPVISKASLDLSTMSKPKRGTSVMSKNNILPKKEPTKKTGQTHLYALILWLFLLCVLVTAMALAYQRLPLSSLQKRLWPQSHSPSTLDASVGVFSSHLKVLEQRFPSQRLDVWKRAHIHLQRHLQTSQPKEPVSVILTAGNDATATLSCLALGLATAFSLALNGSVLELDGGRLAHKDGNQVKLDLDNQLRRAFEGNQPAAVIHRLEELPPSSTLIFYRYCDHENAAYKHPLLTFTVLLPLDNIGPELSLKEVEEKVHGHMHNKFLVPGQPNTFDKMDVNKLSGLWSRISHLVLPVNAELDVERDGCGRG